MNEIDLKRGGTINFGNDRRVSVEPHSQREHLQIHGRAVYEFLFYNDPQPSKDLSDRIHMLITTSENERLGWLMNVQDAIIIIRGLAMCVQKAIEAGVPLAPEN